MCVCFIHALDSWSPESLQLIIGWSMGKAVIFHTPHIPSSCSRRTVKCLFISETLHLERANPSLPLSYRAVCVYICRKVCWFLPSDTWRSYITPNNVTPRKQQRNTLQLRSALRRHGILDDMFKTKWQNIDNATVCVCVCCVCECVCVGR